MRPRRSPLRAGLAILLAAVTFLGFSSPQWAAATAQSTSATPSTSSTIDGLPEGPLGTQIQWLVDYLNMTTEQSAMVDLTDVFTTEVLAQVSVSQMAAILAHFRDELGPFHMKPGSILTTRDMPATTARFVLVGKHDVELPTSLSVDRKSGKINGLFFENPLTPEPSTPVEPSVASPAAMPAGSPGASPAASPEASPVGGLVLPQGALGEQITWLLDTVNGTGEITEADVQARFTPDFLATTPAKDIITQIELVRASAPVAVKDNLIIMTMDYPPSTSGFVLQSESGAEFQVGVTIDVDSGLIRGFSIEPLFVGA